ncbi:hypothetical protein [Aquibacillus saliphilus]|uniref:hypothetical protein n=1 Tax=Aquibacillus saliphilus TaxID=1909422 RepID=UPI001CF092AA|nr:hypothetical protein [Aquibacillus saliphilus]
MVKHDKIMFLNEKTVNELTISEYQMLAIKDGVEEGFNEQGYKLTSRDRLMISMTVKVTKETIDQLLEEKYDKLSGCD